MTNKHYHTAFIWLLLVVEYFEIGGILSALVLGSKTNLSKNSDTFFSIVHMLNLHIPDHLPNYFHLPVMAALYW